MYPMYSYSIKIECIPQYSLFPVSSLSCNFLILVVNEATFMKWTISYEMAMVGRFVQYFMRNYASLQLFSEAGLHRSTHNTRMLCLPEKTYSTTVKNIGI